MTRLNIDINDHKFRELLTYWRKVIGERLRRGQYYEDPRYGMLVLTRREFLKLLLSLGIAGALATLGIGMFNAHWVWAQETTNPPPTPTQYNYGELNWLELTVRGTPLGEGLIGEYLFLEGAGATLHDTSGNNYHGIIYGAIWGQLKNGKYYLKFNGKNNYVKIPDIKPPTPFTLEILCNRTGRGSGTYPRLTTTAVKPNWSVEFGFPDGYERLAFYLQFADGTTTGWNWVNTFRFEYNEWYDVFLLYDGTWIKIFVNGVEIYSSNRWVGKTINPSNGLCLGGPAVSEYFEGMITLTRFFNCALSNQKIQLLYKLAKIVIPDLQ